MNEKFKNIRILGLTTSILWIIMSFGLIAQSSLLIACLLILNIMLSYVVMKDIDFKEIKDMKLNLLGKTNKYISYFLILLMLFGQLVFWHYLIIYYIIIIGLVFKLYPDIKEGIDGRS